MDKTYPVTHTDAEWRRILTPEQYDVMRGHGTERPGSCALLAEKRAGGSDPVYELVRKYWSLPSDAGQNPNDALTK